jgi:F-type H+-transporting ATPase subunit b
MADTPVETGAEAGGAGMPQFLDLPEPDFLARGHSLDRDLPYCRACWIGASLAERGTITNNAAAAEELKQRAIEAEAAYDKALADARSRAGKIVAQSQADIQSELDVQMAKADARSRRKRLKAKKRLPIFRPVPQTR